MKKLIVGLVSLITFSALFTACMKNDVNTSPLVLPADQKTDIQNFITQNGYNMVEYKIDGQSSGIMYEIVNNGNNNGYGDTTNFKPSEQLRFITIVYSGKLLNGTVFDQTTTDKPVKIPILTTNQAGQIVLGVIPAFYDMIRKIGKGGHIRFVTPSVYGYANRTDIQSIPANSPLFFDVQLLDVTAQ